jgi:hypothetical protein
MKRESRKLSKISRMPARLRVAGAERRPLKSERPAYDFRRTDPAKPIGIIYAKFDMKDGNYLVVISKLRRIR